MAKTIHTVLYDDVLDGSKIVTMDNCVCQLYDIKRDYDALIRDSKENLAKPALYVLLNRNAHKAYIGETDDFSQRIASHMLKKSSGQFRHLVKDEFVLTSGDNIRFVVSNQWDKVNILNLLQIAKNQGWSYEILK